MRQCGEQDPRWIDVDDDDLVRRLRHLQWPEVPSDLRQRCWDDFSQRIASRAAGPQRIAGSGDARRRDVSDRYDYSRPRECTRGIVPSARLAASRSSAGSRPSRVALSIS